MDVPVAFQRRLESEFNGRLRARWSRARGEFHIEQQVGRAVLAPTYVSDWDDDTIRARDGYGFVMAIRPGTRMPCPECGITLDVPVMHSAEVKCPFCRTKGKDGRYPAAYYPLEGDALIQHLRRIDPLNTWRATIAKDADAANKRRLKGMERAVDNNTEAVLKDWYKRLNQIPQAGYTGREFKG